MINTLRRIDNLLAAAIAAGKSGEVVLGVSRSSDVGLRYGCRSIKLIVGDFQAKTELIIGSGACKGKIEKFICFDIHVIGRMKMLKMGHTVGCSLVVNLIGTNEATSLKLKFGSNEAQFHRLISPSGPVVMDLKGIQHWDLRSEILKMIQMGSPMHSKKDMYDFLRVWCDAWSIVDKRNAIHYLHTKIPEDPGVIDSAHDMLVKYCVDHDLKILTL